MALADNTGSAVSETTDAFRQGLEQYLDARGIASPQRDIELCVYGMMRAVGQNYAERRARYITERAHEIADSIRVGHINGVDNAFSAAFGDKYLDLFGHKPAYIIGINFNPKSGNHRDHLGKAGRRPFWQRRRENILSLDIATLQEQAQSSAPYLHGVGDKPSALTLTEALERIAYKDGALLITQRGDIYASHTHIINLDPRGLPQVPDDHPEHTNRYGYKRNGDTRHFAAHCGSFNMAGVVFYTLSEETGAIRRFEAGVLTNTTVAPDVALWPS